MTRKLYVGPIFLGLLAALGVGSMLLEKRAAVEAAAVQAPMFEVDPLWPKPLPNHWLIGMTIGVSVDAQDNVWIVHRQGSLERGELHASTNPPMAMCCVAAPPVLEFDATGNLLHHWGGPGNGYDWPDSNHGITVDYKGNVWIGGNGRGKQPTARPAGSEPDESAAAATASYNDNMVLKFTQDGQFLMQIGKPSHSKGSNDLENLRLPAKTFKRLGRQSQILQVVAALAMAGLTDLHQELAVLSEFQNHVVIVGGSRCCSRFVRLTACRSSSGLLAPAVATNPHVAFVINGNAVVRIRPIVAVAWS